MLAHPTVRRGTLSSHARIHLNIAPHCSVDDAESQTRGRLMRGAPKARRPALPARHIYWQADATHPPHPLPISFSGAPCFAMIA